MCFLQELLTFYRLHPCRTLPNAFWKTAAGGDKVRVDFRESPDGDLASLAVWQEFRLMAFWAEDPASRPLTQQQIERVSFALVHADALPVFERCEFSHREAYFRLIHKGKPPAHQCPAGFVYQDVSPQAEAAAVASFIRSCYKNIMVDETEVRGWLSHPVYDPGLWVWVADAATGERAALGIAEWDQQVEEASLEWIQVLPAFQGKGFGKAVAAELLRRTSGIAAFTTVSGKSGDEHRAEGLYRRCGFSGSDIWWLLIN